MLITILEILAVMALIFIIGLLNVKSEVLAKLPDLIAQAESMNAPGADKMKWVVDEIYKSVIPIAKAFFTRTRIESIAQAVFDRIKKYANEHSKRKDINHE